MAMCPLIQKECVQDQCEWWAAGIKKCSLIAMAILLERVHDMGANAYQEYFYRPNEPQA